MTRSSSKHSGKRGVKLGGKKMKGGVSTSDNAIGVFGGIGQQHAAVAGDNTIAMKQIGGNDPAAAAAAAAAAASAATAAAEEAKKTFATASSVAEAVSKAASDTAMEASSIITGNVSSGNNEHVGGGMWVPATLLAANELYKRYGKKKRGSRKGGADVLVPAALLALEEINKRKTRKNGGSKKRRM